MSSATRPIPLRNVFYMLAYAWDRYEFARRVTVGKELNGPDTPAFFAKILHQGCRQLFRRGMDRTYIAREAEIVGARGRIHASETIRHGLLAQGRTFCEYDELLYDAPHNRLLKAALRLLLSADNVPADLARDLGATIRTFDRAGVRDVRPTRHAFRQIQLGRNNAFYGFLLQISEFVVTQFFPDEAGENHVFKNILEDDARFELIFENFVRNFLRSEQTEYQVPTGSERVDWDLDTSPGVDHHRRLPAMYPDIILRSAQRSIIIDAKYYRKTFGTRFEQKKIHSANLYQLFSYLKNVEAKGGKDQLAEGILLYPEVTEPADLRYEIQGHVVRICTVNLNARWENIESSLLALIGLKSRHIAAA